MNQAEICAAGFLICFLSHTPKTPGNPPDVPLVAWLYHPIGIGICWSAQESSQIRSQPGGVALGVEEAVLHRMLPKEVHQPGLEVVPRTQTLGGRGT